MARCVPRWLVRTFCTAFQGGPTGPLASPPSAPWPSLPLALPLRPGQTPVGWRDRRMILGRCQPGKFRSRGAQRHPGRDPRRDDGQEGPRRCHPRCRRGARRATPVAGAPRSWTTEPLPVETTEPPRPVTPAALTDRTSGGWCSPGRHWAHGVPVRGADDVIAAMVSAAAGLRARAVPAKSGAPEAMMSGTSPSNTKTCKPTHPGDGRARQSRRAAPSRMGSAGVILLM